MHMLGAAGLMAAPLICAALCLAAEPVSRDPSPPKTGVLSAKPEADRSVIVESARTALDRWVESQQMLSRERSEWQEGKELLQARAELLKSEIAALQEKITQAQQGVAEVEKKKNELIAQNETLKACSGELAAAASKLEGDIRGLFAALPAPFQEKVKALHQRMPETPQNTKISLAERFQNVVGILNEVTKLNGEITLAMEVRPLSDGKPSEVKTVYVGLAQAYYVSAGGEAGIGRPSDSGWQWKPSDDLALRITEVIEILQNKGKPKFVQLPVEIQ
jgi:gas vesicle protein